MLAALAVTSAPAVGQQPSQLPDQHESLQLFFNDFSTLWLEGDVASIVNLIERGRELLLDTGSGTDMATNRHAAAALRELFEQHNTEGLEALETAVAGLNPPSGFGELTWSYRDRGSPARERRSVYVSAVLVDGQWRIRELRLLP